MAWAAWEGTVPGTVGCGAMGKEAEHQQHCDAAVFLDQVSTVNIVLSRLTPDISHLNLRLLLTFTGDV